MYGRVQGVFYRGWSVQKARSLGLAGWVRNEADGTVAIHLEGDPAAVSAMIAHMHDGPPAARVERIDETAAVVEGVSGFRQK